MLSREEIEKVLIKYYQAWNEHDLDGVMELCHDEILFENWTGEQVKGKKKIKVGNINSLRDFLDVRDAVKAYILLAQKGKNNNIYNIGSGIGTKIKDLIELFVRNVNSDIQIISDPELYKKNDPEIIVADISKIQKQTGWKPSIPLESTLERVLNYWRKKLLKKRSNHGEK